MTPESNSTTPILSLVTICHNSASTIRSTLQSVADQKNVSKEDFEHLVIDGASRDETLEIVKSFSNLKIISEPDRGISDAFNKGVKLSRGKWILFLNSNDKLHDDMVLSDVISKLKTTEAEIVYGKIAVVHALSGKVLRVGGRDGAWNYLHQRMTLPHPALFMRRSYFERHGFFREDFKIAMDYELLLRGFRQSQFLFMPRTINSFSAGGTSHDRRQIWRQARECLYAKRINKVASWPSRIFWFLYQGLRWTFEAELNSRPAFRKLYTFISQRVDRGF